MFRTLGAIAALLVLALSFYGGTRWGSRGLAQARADLAAVRDAEQRVKAEDTATRQAIEQRLAAVDAEHRTKLEAMQRDFEQQKSALQASLDKAQASGAALRGRATSAGTDLARIRQQMAGADAERLETLRKREQRVLALEAQFGQRAAAADCLALPVPPDVVKSLAQAGQ